MRKGLRGMSLYARMIAQVRAKPMTAYEISEALGVAKPCTVRVMRHLHHLRLVFIFGWRQDVWRGPHNELWSFGAGKDAPMPLTTHGKPSKRKPPKTIPFSVEAYNFAAVIKAMQDGTDLLSLMELTGMSRSTLYPLLHMLRELKMIYTADWHRNDFGNPSPIMMLGQRSNASPPKPLGTNPEKRRARQRRGRHMILVNMMASSLA